LGAAAMRRGTAAVAVDDPDSVPARRGERGQRGWGLAPCGCRYLLSTEVLRDLRSVCLSHVESVCAMLGSGLGDRLRDERAMGVHCSDNKKGHLLAF
jgi:hypothetical protein